MPAKETLLTAVQATNFPNYMYEVGVDGFTRKIACSLYPTATNELVDGQIKISTSSTFKSGENVFNLGEPFTETTADGREVTTTATREGNTLVKNQVSRGGAPKYWSSSSVSFCPALLPPNCCHGSLSTSPGSPRCVWTLPAAVCPPSRAGSSRRTG